jgi:tetratricopeptide (TPR) repeat protein
MTAAGPSLRSAQSAVDGARAAVERLDETRHPDENAADLLEAWDGVQNALRSIVRVPTTSDAALIREARSRNVISLDEAHALLEFSASAERCRDGAYTPNAKDIESARGAFHLLDAALARAPLPPGPGIEGRGPSDSAATAPIPPLAEAPSPLIVTSPNRGNLLAKLFVGIALVAILAAIGYYTMALRGRDDALKRGVAAYTSGNRALAKSEFGVAAEKNPKSAEPHVYLGRIAREEGDPVTAARELNTAVTLEPENPLALREMGAHLLALGNLDLARRFYIRAVQQAPTDRHALGYLACTLNRLGRYDEAQRFAQRAGPGEWSGCAAASPQAPQPVPGGVIPR